MGGTGLAGGAEEEGQGQEEELQEEGGGGVEERVGLVDGAGEGEGGLGREGDEAQAGRAEAVEGDGQAGKYSRDM